MFMVRKVIAATLEHKLLASHYLKTKEPRNAAILLPGAYSTELKPKGDFCISIIKFRHCSQCSALMSIHE